MVTRLIVIGCVVFGLSGTARAAAEIVTAGLETPDSGALECRVVNASAKKTLVGTIELLNVAGTVIDAISFSLAPRTTRDNNTTNSTARFCVVTVTKGGKKNARVSFYAIDSAGDIVAAVTGR